MRKVVLRLANLYARRRVAAALPGIEEELAAYSHGSSTTGTQWVTLWLSVRTILRHRPKWVLESGTGASTLVLAAALQRAMREGDYVAQIVSMESIQTWFDTAVANLPARYADVVEIVHGPREPFPVAMFRGYIHSRIPARNYDFVFLDGPDYRDENGIAFCADIFRAMDLSDAPLIRGVIDGRVSSVMVLQQMFGVSSARYWKMLHATVFVVPRTQFRDSDLALRDVSTTLFGGLSIRKFRKRR